MNPNCESKLMTGRSLRHDRDSIRPRASSDHLRSGRNAFCLLVKREVCPKTKHVPKRHWGEVSQWNSCLPSVPKSEPARDAKRGLVSWVEAESLKHLAAKYCPLLPPPRSTIAAAFSPDGRTLASTHGDHTVKIINCQTGNCLKVLSGHRRTPWVVRFHPLHPEILASGSLDYEVRLWDANTAECIGSRDFYRPIASIAFHAEGELLAVASGHKLYIWHYNKRGEASSPTIVLKTRRSLRAVHFHPHAAPFLLTAEVNDLDSSDSVMSRATSPGYLKYPPPAVFVAKVNSGGRVSLGAELPLMPLPSLFVPSFSVDDTRPMQIESSSLRQFKFDTLVSPMETFPAVPSSSYTLAEGTTTTHTSPSGRESGVSETMVDAMETDEKSSVGGNVQGNCNVPETSGNSYVRQQSSEFGQIHQHITRDPTLWELRHLHDWLMGQSRAGVPSMPAGTSLAGVSGESIRPGETPNEGANNQPIFNRIQSEIEATLAAAAAAELPCTVKLRVWSHDIKKPCAPLNTERCRLTIPHAVLCSEMGAHFSPCGRYLAACVACMVPNMEADLGVQALIQQDTGAATSPTRHPISAHQVMYELRIYSLEEATFGSVLVSRAIRAAHCLTSIQFSPTSEHILLAYGRRHGSLLKSIVIDGETTFPIYTVLEVYRVSDMELVRVLPSAEDEVNVACFHPSAGGGLVYGTKEGKLRVLQYNGAHGVNCNGSNHSPGDNISELQVQTYALEG